jgi:hypothetical protein
LFLGCFSWFFYCCKKILVAHGSHVASYGSLDVSQGSSQECFFHRFLQFIHYCLFFFISLSIASHGSSIVSSVALIVYTSPHGSSNRLWLVFRLRRCHQLCAYLVPFYVPILFYCHPSNMLLSPPPQKKTGLGMDSYCGVASFKRTKSDQELFPFLIINYKGKNVSLCSIDILLKTKSLYFYLSKELGHTMIL